MFQSLKNIFHLLEAIAAVLYYRYPAKSIRVIGVTGTDGKTTTSTLIHHILEEAKLPSSLVTSVAAYIGGKEYDTGFHVTTPQPINLQRFIRKAVDAKSKYIILETTSHALDQNRVFGANFFIGVLSNITHEHLDYHKTYGKYLHTKARLFKSVKYSVLNEDDESFNMIKNLAGGQVSTYGIKRGKLTPSTFPFKTKLPGLFNKYNCLAAIATCKILKIDDETIRKGILSFNLPLGRMDEIKNNRKIKIIIDFAHTPNGLENALKAGRELLPNPKGRIINVFGAAGLRDFTKRPIMGEIASKYASVIILTAEDPRTESLEKIIDQISQGCLKGGYEEITLKDTKQNKLEGKFIKIPDRQKAISVAIRMIAKPGDLVIITGKGHEKSMCFDHSEIPWSDYDAVKIALQKPNSL